MDEGIIASLQFIDYKLITISIFEKLASVELYNVRTLTNPPNSYFSDGFSFFGTQ